MHKLMVAPKKQMRMHSYEFLPFPLCPPLHFMERGLGGEVIIRKWKGTESFKGKKPQKPTENSEERYEMPVLSATLVASNLTKVS